MEFFSKRGWNSDFSQALKQVRNLCVSGWRQEESFSCILKMKKRKENMSLYIIVLKSSPERSSALFTTSSFSSFYLCSLNGLKFILYLKRRRRAEEKLTNTKIERRSKTGRKGFREIILSDKWKIDDILWF